MLETVATLLLVGALGAVPQGKAEAHARTEIAEAMRLLPIAKAGRIDKRLKEGMRAGGGTIRYKTPKDKARHVADIQRRLDHPALNFPPLDVARDPTGSVGRLERAGSLDTKTRELWCRVFQVLGDQKSLLKQHRTVLELGHLGGKTFVNESYTAKELFVLDDFLTEGWIDDRPVGDRFGGKLFVLTGTTTYQSAAGPRTVKRVAPWSVSLERMTAEIAAAEAKTAEARKTAEAKRKQEEHEKSFRTWTDTTGKFSVEAQFKGMAAGKATLRKRDGTTVKLAVEKLSKADREWIQNRAKAKR